ncbi:MAG: 50S ribosomal protein L32 [bacterium]
MTQKKKRTPSSQGKRRSHHALKPKTLNVCSKCKKPVEPHRACSACGTYKGQVVLKIKTKPKKK